MGGRSRDGVVVPEADDSIEDWIKSNDRVSRLLLLMMQVINDIVCRTSKKTSYYKFNQIHYRLMLELQVS